MKSMIFTLVGKDKPGLLGSVSQTVFKLGGNWLSSNFSHMAGHFAGFVEVHIPDDKQQELVDTLSKHPHLQIHLVSGESPAEQSQQTANINIMGNDKPGIVQELSTVLNQFNINIVKFNSSCGSAPNWGGLLFTANTTISIPDGFDLDTLREALEEIANDLVVDIELA
jgi:glycine cleavage system regulatory protein